MSKNAWQILGLGALTAVTLAGVLWLLGSWPPETDSVAAPPPPAPARPIQPEPAAPTTLQVPAHPKVLVLGDSISEGYASKPPTQGFAYRIGPLLGGESVVDGVSGSGYVNDLGDSQDFLTRARDLKPSLHPDLVVLEGGINDASLPMGQLQRDATATVHTVQRTYPHTPVVMLGLILRTQSADAQGFADAQDTLRQVATDTGVWFVDPVQQQWLTPANDQRFLIGDHIHPNTAGHAYVARRLASALRSLEGQAAG